MIESK